MALRSFVASESAVSESVGYILILGIMVFSIGMIYMIGYPALQNSIDDSHMQNMERGFTILGNNIDHVVSQESPKQNVELNLKGGTIKTDSKDTIDIKLIDINGVLQLETTMPIMKITYVYHGDKQIGYEFGGVWENIGTNGYVLKDPKIIVGDPFIIPLIDADSSGSSVGGEGVAKVIIDQGAPVINQKNNIRTIEFAVTSDYYKGWEKYFESIHLANVHVDDVQKIAYGTYSVPLSDADGITVIEVDEPLYIDIIL